MGQYERVRVTAPDGPQMRLANRFPAEEFEPDTEEDSIILVADPDRVREFIDGKGQHEGWAQWVEDIEAEEIDDPTTLPYKLQGLVESSQARVWEFARELIPADADVNDYIWHNRIDFTWGESVVDKLYAEPPTVEVLETWVEDDYFQFDLQDANPTQNPHLGEGDGVIFDWNDALVEDHPAVELRAKGSLRPPMAAAPHGYAYLDGVIVTMADGGALDDEVVNWCERRFWAEYDAETGIYDKGEKHIVQADEFDIYDEDGREWLRIWWD